MSQENVKRLMDLIQSDYAGFWREVFAEGMTADHTEALDLSPEDVENDQPVPVSIEFLQMMDMLKSNKIVNLPDPELDRAESKQEDFTLKLNAAQSATSEIQARIPSAKVFLKQEIDLYSKTPLSQLIVEMDDFSPELSDFLDQVNEKYCSYFTIIESFSKVM